MSLLISRRKFLSSGILGLGAVSAIGCGTILHPERKGQASGNLDWSIVALDGIGLLFFLVPGVIAFAVDFNNGSIYLPASDSSQTAQRGQNRTRNSKKLVALKTASGRLTSGAVEHLLSQHTGKPVRLIHGQYETHPLNSLEEFWNKTV